MYTGRNLWKQKRTLTSAENSGQQTYKVDLRRPVLKVLIDGLFAAKSCNGTGWQHARVKMK